jgi:hypothetical protein
VTVPHAVIAAVTDDRQATPYQNHLASKITAARVDAALLT